MIRSAEAGTLTSGSTKERRWSHVSDFAASGRECAGAILVLVDQRTSGGEALPFLGRDALTATAIAGMARKLGAPLLPAVALRDASGHGFDIRFEPDITRESDLETMRALNDRIAHWVGEAPGQWFWLHQRWRGRRGRGFLGAEEGPGG